MSVSTREDAKDKARVLDVYKRQLLGSAGAVPAAGVEVPEPGGGVSEEEKKRLSPAVQGDDPGYGLCFEQRLFRGERPAGDAERA